MYKKNRIISVESAIRKASTYAGTTPEEIHEVDIQYQEEGMYTVAFCDDWMLYQCYVDGASGEICGFFSEPTDL